MDVEKTMEFILSVQARLEASAQQHDERIAKLESSMADAANLIGRLAQAEILLAERMTAGFQELREIQAGTEAKLNELHANTESKLNALIDTVDKLVRRNGNKE